MRHLNTSNRYPKPILGLRYFIIILIGFAISILSGLLGIGGGSLMVPAMIYIIGINQHKAHGTSLAVMSPVVLLTAIYYAKHGQMNWAIAVELAIGGVIGAAIGAKLCTLMSANLLRKLFGAFLAIVGIKMLFDVSVAAVNGSNADLVLDPLGFIGMVAIIALGVITGVFSGLLGVGGGIIMIPAMVLLLGVSQKMAQGISLAVIIPVSISGALMHARNGNVDGNTAIWLAIGGIAGALLGAHLALGMSAAVLRSAFGVPMVAMGSLSFLRAPSQLKA